MTLNLSFFSLPAQENANRSSAAPSRIQIVGAPHFLISFPPKKKMPKKPEQQVEIFHLPNPKTFLLAKCDGTRESTNTDMRALGETPENT